MASPDSNVAAIENWQHDGIVQQFGKWLVYIVGRAVTMRVSKKYPRGKGGAGCLHSNRVDGIGAGLDGCLAAVDLGG